MKKSIICPLAVVLFMSMAPGVKAQNSLTASPDKVVSGRIPPHPPVLPADAIPAFPGAWGGGMYTIGGRGGKVIAVTNINDAGPGSLRAALSFKGPRIIVFRVAGTIELKDDLFVNDPYVTIAGQSAPGDGICIAGTLNINTHNVIIRHIRVRRGLSEGGQGDDNIGGYPEHHIIIDHCSTSWGMDENISLYRYMAPSKDGKASVKTSIRNLTIQWSISSEALNARNHAFGGTWGGNPSSFHHNLFASNTARNPSIGMSGPFDFRYNVIFNWRHRSIDGGDETSTINIMNNYFKPGPATLDDVRGAFARMELRNGLSPAGSLTKGSWYPKEEPRPGKWYVAGNIMDGNEAATADNWLAMQRTREPGKGGNIDGDELKSLARVNTPFEAWPVAPHQTADMVYEAVLSKVGATLPKRDAVDKRVTEMVRTGKPMTATGIIKDIAEVGGYPTLTFKLSEVAVDTDGDGMPDAWELKHQLNPKNSKDGALDTDGDGYTNVEEFLNGTNPRQKIDYRNLDNNIDTVS